MALTPEIGDEVIAAVEEAGRVFSERFGSGVQSRDSHLSATQLRVLEAIEEYEAPVVSTLAATLDMGMPSVSRVCDRLEASGWVARQPVDDDRRLIEITLTARGRRLLGDVRRQRRKLIGEVMARMPATQQQALRRGLVAFAAAAGTSIRVSGRSRPA
ncbi:hypothetical protein Athai_60680 [Actinocatenispora thailandica]|uniref:HTH marR-type domain-containing protein n=1 Tax=Actinocatenispora thailandica TaxID=227318 RepID=A0A7R7DVE2_9ACTN|nr:MarR family transcriptional regulator [Actinocatenispora thailandica]BCJ38565.1 hypothetical protein Athai_60680 [Actinocatenispora thailandica]